MVGWFGQQRPENQVMSFGSRTNFHAGFQPVFRSAVETSDTQRKDGGLSFGRASAHSSSFLSGGRSLKAPAQLTACGRVKAPPRHR